jgi:hypothetical protein
MSEIEELQRQINRLKDLSENLKPMEGPGKLVDYFATSTKVGWSAYTASNLSYMRVGNLLHVFFYIDGTSNSATTSVTLPYSMAAGFEIHWPIRIMDNAAYAFGFARIVTGTPSTMDFRPDVVSSNWTGTAVRKLVIGGVVIPV